MLFAISFPRRSGRLKERTNEQWLADLTRRPPRNSQALQDLKDLIERKLGALFSDRPAGRTAANERVSALHGIDVERFIAERLHTFRGESHFTSWALRVAIGAVYSDLRRARWSEFSLDAIAMPRFPFDPEVLARRGETPQRQAVKRDLVVSLNRAIDATLGGRQRRALVAIMFHGVAIEEVADRMGMNRDALYKMLHDARRRLKRAIEADGFSAKHVDEILS